MSDPRSFRSFLSELKRRNVFRVAISYLVVAFVIVQVADLAAGAFGLPEWFEPMAWVMCALGFPIALLLAWAFDLGPDGLRRTRASGGSGSAETPASVGRRRGRGIGTALWLVLLVLGVTAGWVLRDVGRTEVTDRSIAVLPFRATGGDESVEFGQGLHDGLLTRLTNVAALTVKSRTSSQRYEGTEMPIPDIASELGVAWIVEGSVYLSGGQIRVNATLIDALGDDRRWSRDYDRDVTIENVFEIQTDLAQTIARSLEAELSPRERERVAARPTNDLDAYRLYLQGRTIMRGRTEPALRRAVEYFSAAIERDSSYARAWSGLADVRMLLVIFGYEGADTGLARALSESRRALALDPDLAEARTSMAQLLYGYLRDAPSALAELEAAIELNPSYAQAHQWLGTLEGGRGRREAALGHLQRAAELDPFSAVIQLVLGWTYWWIEGPGPNALSHIREARDLESDFAAAHVDEGFVLSHAGRHEEAVAALERGLDRTTAGTFEWRLALAGLGVAYARQDSTERSRQYLSRLEGQGEAPFFRAMIHSALGETEEAFRALSDVEWTSVLKWDLLVFPSLAPLREDPRYERLVRETNELWGLNPDGSVPNA